MLEKVVCRMANFLRFTRSVWIDPERVYKAVLTKVSLRIVFDMPIKQMQLERGSLAIGGLE